jgi:hypothetical protein
MKPTIVDAVAALHSNVNFSINNNKIVAWDISEVKKNIPEPKQADIDAKLIELQAEYDAQEYARNRAIVYPSTGDQLDMMYKDTKNSTTTHADAVEAVKTKWPKDNSGPV